MRRIFVCSPYQGEIENLERALKYCRYVANQGHAPFAPHLIYPQFMDEETERETGINFGKLFLKVCDEVWTFRPEDIERTEGMQKEMYYAVQLKKPISYFIEKNNGEIVQI